MDGIYKLKGVVQHYSWGGTEFIPQLLGVSNVDENPFAEYWLGAHVNAPAQLEGENITLHQLISNHPTEVLGKDIANKFGSLPYLFKILDVKQMLSIQVHPSKRNAKKEFELENEKGISLTAPNRNYKDKNHKPELMVALSDFWLLHGFKKEEDVIAVLNRVEQLSFLLPVFQTKGYKGLYELVMTMPQEKVNEILAPLMKKILQNYEAGSIEKSDEHFWAARAGVTFCKSDNYDRGIFSIYLFNLIHLRKGEAIFQPAGLPHAYLEGQNVEVMANSDNVLRAGLTDKHVDVPELMKHVKFEATHPNIIKASDAAEQTFAAPVTEFLLKKQLLDKPISLSVKSISIFFVYEGEGKITAGEKTLPIKKGEAILVLPAYNFTVVASGQLTVYSVSTPADKN